MKQVNVIFLLMLLSITSFAQSKKKVLFIGNSYTYFNNLPQLVADIALSKQDTVLYDSSAPGGYTFQMHCTNTTTWQKIRSQKWDVVVLQAQSQEPSFSPAQVMSQTYPFAKRLSDSVRANNSCTEVMFFMTWGRKNGDLSNCATYSPVCTFSGMNARLRESYMMFKDSFAATAAPVGVAWKNFRNTNPLVDLYISDESHPSLQGSYLAACVFYSSIFKKTTVGSSYNPSLPTTELNAIQTIASQTVLDSMQLWGLGSNKPTANFTYSVISASQIQFINSSSNANTYQWSFGSSSKNPVYTFSGPGTYTVQLKSKNACTSDSITKTVTLTGIKEHESSVFAGITYYNNQLIVKLNTTTEYNLSLYSTDGKLIRQEKSLPEGSPYYFKQINQGIYLLKLESGNSYTTRKVIITD